MHNEWLYSSIWPLLTREEDETIEDRFIEEVKKSDQLELAVGFVSYKSLRELDKLVTQQNIKNVSLILGMYFFNGFPEELLKLTLEINDKWQKSGIGEIRVINSFRYHGKLYCFLKNHEVYSTIIGSPNLSFLTTKLMWQQYETAILTNDLNILEKTKSHIDSLKSENISKNIAILAKNQQLIVIKTDAIESKNPSKINRKNILKK